MAQPATPNASNSRSGLAGALRFLREVRAELRRVTWPTGADTRRMTLMVFILVTIIALFLIGVDLLIGLGLNVLFGLN